MEKDKKGETWNNYIVAEVRAIRDAHARAFNYDLSAIFQNLSQKQEEHRQTGWKFVRRPPKRIEKEKTGTHF